MRLMLKFALCCLLVSTAFAQHRGGGGGHAGISGGHAGFTGGRAGGYGHGYHGNYGRGSGYRHSFYGRGFYGRYGGWPWLYGAAWWPWWDYGFWDGPEDYSDSYPATYPYAGDGSSPNVTVVYPPPQETAYPAVINVPTHPVVREYRQPEDYGLPEDHSNRPVLYLIAFKDHIIRAAMAYWTEGDTLHYLDTDHKEMHAPLATVDREFSAQLNRERRVPFQLK